MATIKKIPSMKRTFLFLSSFALILSFFSALILPTSDVSALTVEECFEKFDGERAKNPGQNGVGGLNSDATNALNKSNCKAYCEADREANEIKCSKEHARSTPLINIVCDRSDTLDCGDRVDEEYLKCKDGIVDTSRTGQKDYGSAAACFKAEFKPKRGEVMPTTAQLKKAFKDGAKAGEKAEDASKKQCEDAGKKWNDGKCVDKEAGKTDSTCNIEGIGWIVCPVVNFMAKIIDQSYVVVDGMLTVHTFTSDDTSDRQLKSAWESMRNIANIAFVLAFLFIIYSQITGFGVSNYGIKKLLPRIIIAAILVNISYWICAIAVDISNVFGSSMKDLFSGLGGNFVPKDLSWMDNGKGWTGIAGGVLAAGATTTVLLYIGLAALLPALVVALIAIVTVLIVLVIRQALIILLIVVAPLAFVAFLLPNTESWFKKWRELFQILLLMYPVIGAIFGASQLASEIVMNSAAGPAGEKMAIQIMGAAIAIIPLFITPIVMRTAGSTLNNIAGKINNPNKGPFDRMRKGAENIRDSRRSAMRERRMNYSQGKNKFTRGWRRAAGLSTRTGVRMKAGADRNKAAEEAAEAGLLMNDERAIDAGAKRMAKSAADSARQGYVFDRLNKSGDAEAGIVSGIEEQNRSLGSPDDPARHLDAALDAQKKTAERQAIGEVEGKLSSQSLAQIGDALEHAIIQGDTITAQAAENKLAEMGNGGANKLEEVIARRDADTGSNTNWEVMRTELARNMKGDLKSRNEALKQWSDDTELSETETGKAKLDSQRQSVDENGNPEMNADGTPKMKNINRSFSDIKSNVLSANQDMKLDKFAKQTPSMQSQLIESGAISVTTMQSAVNPTNSRNFSTKDIARMEQLIKAAAEKSNNGTSSGGNRE